MDFQDSAREKNSNFSNCEIDNEKLNLKISEAKSKPRYSQRRWAVLPEKHRNILKLLKHGVGIRRIAEIVGVGVRTVQRRKKFLSEQHGNDDRDQIAFEVLERTTRRCHVHGEVSVWPCAICAALEAKQARPN